MNAVIYARYSSHNQREESIEGQLRECNEYANKNGLTVIGEYCDHALSGKTDSRPQFQKMIKDSDKGKFDAVIMYTLDRFARNRYDSAIYKAKLRKNGVKIFYAKQPMPDTPEGIILESVLEGYAEYYSENLSRSIKRGMKENAIHGLAPSTTAPIGYIINKERKYEIDPVGAKVVKMVFEKYANGESAVSIINYLNDKGYKTSRGNLFNKNSIRKIIENEKYIGVYNYMGVYIEDGIPPIIDKELFEKAQSVRKHNSTCRAKNKAKEDYLLTTKLFCGHCGEPMVGESGTSKTGKMYFYYKCITRKRKHTCDKEPVKKDWIEDVVIKYTVSNIFNDETIDLIATKAAELIQKENEDVTYVNSLKSSLKETNDKIKNILKAIENGIFSDTMNERLSELERDKKSLEENISREELRKPVITKDHIVYWLEQFKNGDIKNPDYRRTIVDMLVNSVYLYDNPDGTKKIVVTYNTSVNNTTTIESSDIELSTPLEGANPNTIFFVKNVFGFVIII